MMPLPIMSPYLSVSMPVPSGPVSGSAPSGSAPSSCPSLSLRGVCPVGLVMGLTLLFSAAPLALGRGGAQAQTQVQVQVQTQVQAQLQAQLTRPEPNEAVTCKVAALARLQQHRVATGESLGAIAQRYGLTSATLMGFNPSIRDGSVTPGETLVIPPYNGIRVNASGKVWTELSQQYQVRPDVLFEVNGCVSRPTTAFIPGVNWEPGIENAVVAAVSPTPSQPPQLSAPALTGYPLLESGSLLSNYGWQLDPAINEEVFHGGFDIAAAVGDAVFSIGEGTVAYAAEQGDYGMLVVVNHSDGLQSRYAQLSEVQVQVGQKVAQNARLGSVGQTGRPSSPESHLHFEVRVNSALGWVAQDPTPFLSKQVGVLR